MRRMLADSKPAAERVKLVCDALKISPQAYLIGRTVIFLNDEALRTLDDARAQRLKDSRVLMGYTMRLVLMMSRRRRAIARRRAAAGQVVDGADATTDADVAA